MVQYFVIFTQSHESLIDGFDPTTPATTKIGPPRGVPRQAKAGPSKPATAAAKKANKVTQDKNGGDTSRSHDVVVLSSDDDGKKAARKDSATKGKGKAKEPAVNDKPAPAANGSRPKPKPKAKAKVDSPAQPDAMEVDGGPAEDTNPPARTSRTARTNVKPVSDEPSPPPAKRPRQESALEAEITRLRSRLDDVSAVTRALKHSHRF